MITIIQDRRRYEFITSQQYKTVMRLTVKYDKSDVLFIPVEDKSIDIDVRDSSGGQMIQLSPGELENRFGITGDDMSDDHIPHGEKFVRVPVLLNAPNSGFETVTVTYVSPLDPRRYSASGRSFNMSMVFGFRITPGEFSIGSSKYEIKKAPYDLHITMETGDDYKIRDDYEISVEPQKGASIVKQSKKTTNLAAFHISMDFDSEVCGKITIVIADSLSNTAAVISAAGTAIPVLLIAIQIATGNLLESTLEILGGVIAVLIGSRIWVIQDKYIMRRWVGLYHATLILNSVLFVLWLVFWTSASAPLLA